MDITTQETLLGIAFFALITIILFIIARYTYLIRKAMAENGLAPSRAITKMKLLSIGGILVGLGIGLMVSSLFTLMELQEETADLLIWGTIVIFGGIGLISAHFLDQKFGREY